MKSNALPQVLRRLCGDFSITFLALPSKAQWRAAILLPVFGSCFFSFYFSNSLATARGTDPEGSLATARGTDPENSLATARGADSRSSFSQASIFREVAAEVGLKFSHFNGSTGEFYMPEIMGAGVALFDYDGDGDLDVYLVQGALLDPAKKMSEAKFPPPSPWAPGARLFRNELIPNGKLRFTDVTAQAGVGHVGYGMGVAVGDYDNDGDLDLYVTNFGSNVLYRNNGNGTFTDVTVEAGVDDPRWRPSAAFWDDDRAGDRDLFVPNYFDFTLKGNKRCYAPTGEADYCAPPAYRPAPARLFRNQGDGKFVDVTQTSGIGSAFGPGLGVTCADFNNDGWVDIYVANDGAANLLWVNKGDGTFEEAGVMGGAVDGG